MPRNSSTRTRVPQESGRGPAEAVRFVIIAAPRTGSNWVCAMLNSHPSIICHHELFNPEAIHYSLDRRGELDLGTVEERDRAPLAFLQRVWQLSFGKLALGFKFNLGQNGSVLQDVLADRGVRKIVLIRRNRIKTFVSELIAEKTGRWESYDQNGRPSEIVKVKVEVAALLEHVARNADYYGGIYAGLRSSGQGFLEVAYERLNAADEWSRILGFLGVPGEASGLTSRTSKQNPTDLRELILNFNEVEAALKGSRLEPELYSLQM